MRVRHTVLMSTRTEGQLVEALRSQGRPVRFRRGQALFSEGDLAERVFVIEHGWVIVSSVAAGGREIVLGLCGAGDMMGDLAVLDGGPRSGTAIAADDVEATVAPASVLLRALIDPDASMELLRVLAGRLREADRRRLEFAALGTLGRVARRLVELGERFGHDGADGIAAELPLSQEQLASWCGASREATVKALATLRKLGCIRTGRRSVLICDMDALRGHGYSPQ